MIPKWLFRFWRNRVILRSVGWWRTRRKVLKEQDEYCHYRIGKKNSWVECGETRGLQIHHNSYNGHVKFRWYHLLPFARFFMWRIDTSDMTPLCSKHHKKVELMKRLQK